MTTRLPLIESGIKARPGPVGSKRDRRALKVPAIFVIHGQGDMAAAQVAQRLAGDARQAGLRTQVVVEQGLGPRSMLGEKVKAISNVESAAWELNLESDLDLVVAAGHAFPAWLKPELTLLVAPTPNPASWDEATRLVRDRYDLCLTEYRPSFLKAWQRRRALAMSTKP